ncbi:MAG: hypothetical protein JWO36_61 [Myxococcales bacterium]|nr:hypothetical protein [Myxococcales bacterium]
MRSPGLRFAFVVARLLFSAMDFYRWMNTPKNGVGNQMFTCVVPSHRELSANEIEMDLTLPVGYEVCWDFFLISSGNMEELPRLLGLQRSKVVLTEIPRGARYRVTVPIGTPFFRRIWRAITWPFTARAAARELKEAHENLLERYEELDTARAKLDQQATQLRTAHTINDLIHGDLDLVRTQDTIAKALVEQAGFVSAQIRLSSSDEKSVRIARFGSPEHENPLKRNLDARGGQTIGEVSVVSRSDADPREREDLLEFIVPTLAMALQNAISYQTVEEYRTGLERLVAERTAELTQARDQLAGTVVQLRDAQNARERFFGNISHEIRTPLSLILLAVSDIEARAGDQLDTRARRGLGAVNDAARKLVRLVDELLLLAAGQEGKLKVHPEPVDLAALLHNVVSAWLPAAENAGLELVARIPPSLLAKVDPVAIERVASNLTSNAMKYTPRGGMVEIELVEESGELRFSVLDTGPGFGEELASRLFGRFERASGEDRRKVGTGIGLSLVKQLVEAHGGRIAALSRPGGGSELRVVLPASALIRDLTVTAARVSISASSVPSSGSAIVSGARFAPEGQSAGTIVLAEDDAQLAEMVARLLSDRYTVHVGLDGVAALELVRLHQPELLVTDVDMPHMSGIELSRKFREITGDRLSPIIILSAVLDLGTRLAGLEAGAVDYVSKPFDPLELVARVNAQFRMRDLAVRLHRAEQLSALGILTAGLAHELRNPANGIVNAVAPLIQLLPPELTQPDSGVGQLLEVMTGCAEQISFLSRQLLSFRNGGAGLELRQADAQDLVDRAIALAQQALVGVDVRTDLAAARALNCAPPLLVQVLTNLIENAAHAAKAGGWVEVRALTGPGKIMLEVADSGPGVPLPLRERVFEPFFTTKPPGSGTGLGLSVARTIVHRHGGVLEIRERNGRCMFVIELPHDSTYIYAANAL